MSAGGTTVLQAYDRWAAHYPPEPHNPLMRAEHQAMLQMWPDVDGAHTLDLACGSGRYGRVLAAKGAAHVVSSDFSQAMLRRLSGAGRVRGDMMNLPFADHSFAFVICGLAVGHADDLTHWMCEVSRVLATRGTLLVSDFHPAAAAAGMTRSFVDEHQHKHIVPHRSYDADDHRRAAAAAGLTIDCIRELRIGVELCEPFQGAESFYRRWHGLPVVLIVRAKKAGG